MCPTEESLENRLCTTSLWASSSTLLISCSSGLHLHVLQIFLSVNKIAQVYFKLVWTNLIVNHATPLTNTSGFYTSVMIAWWPVHNGSGCSRFVTTSTLDSNWRLWWKKGVRLFTQKCVKNVPNFACSFVYVCQTMFCMFFPWSLLRFRDITYAKKHIFPRASSGDLLLDEKQKKPFVSLSIEVTIIA